MPDAEPMDALAAALAKAQGEMKNAPLNRVNPHFKSKYADLAAIRDATMPALSKHGLSISHRFSFRDGMFVLVTEMRHERGQIIESVYPLPMGGTEQQKGSAITYGKRYSWAGLCGIAADDDDDAEAVTKAQNGNGAKVGDHGGAIPDRTNWKGPLKITELKSAMKQFARDLMACSDLDELTGLLNSPQTKAVLDQCKVDLPEWHSGNGGDIKGAEATIAKVKADLMALERA